MAFRTVRISFTNEDGNTRQITFKQEVGTPVIIPGGDKPVPVRSTPPPRRGGIDLSRANPITRLTAPDTDQGEPDSMFNETTGEFESMTGFDFKPDYSQGTLESPAFQAPRPPSGLSMGGGFTQNIQVKDSGTGQMITQTVTQQMIDNNPSLARFYAQNGFITSDQWQMANGNSTGMFPGGAPRF